MMWDSSFLGALTPKFYVALTGTSSLISGLILIFEWWYFRKYGTSFIEQVSLAHLGPWLGGGGGAVPYVPPAPPPPPPPPAAGGERLVWRNPMALLRGAEYARLWTMARRAPLTYYDMNLTAQEHQALFGCVGDGPAEEALGRAWREREPRARVAAAREALRHAPDCAAALLLLAEEDAPTVLEAERVLRRAWRAAEAALRGAPSPPARARDAAVLLHVKRRAAACQRRLGRLREAARTLRELAREGGGPDDELLELLLEQRAFPDAAALLARPRAPEAAALYTLGLLQARAGAPEAHTTLLCALDANPFVAEYLLELRALSLPPEHVARGGRSEALAYAFFHLRHWRACPAALRRLEAARREAPPPPAPPARDALLVAGGAGGARGAAPPLALCAALCLCAALAAQGAHRWPRRLWPEAAPDESL